jgi:tetratricopeptide (TPR) repeat protein
MAFATGIIIGLVIWQAFRQMFKVTYDGRDLSIFIILITPLCFLFVYQFFLWSFFWGKRRGEFEYSFIEKTAEGGKSLSELRIRLKKIKKDLQYYDDNDVHLQFKELIKVYSDNIVVHFQYGIFCESVGKVTEAIEAYEKTLSLIPKSEKALHTYVTNQINRVKTRGPSYYDGIPGLKYVLW